MTRANFARTKTRHITAFRSISIAVRDWSRAIVNEPTPYPTILTVGIAFYTSLADLNWYSQVLEQALARAAVKIGSNPVAKKNIEAAASLRAPFIVVN